MIKNQRIKTLILSTHVQKTKRPSIAWSCLRAALVMSSQLHCFLLQTQAPICLHSTDPDLHLWHQTQSRHFSGLLILYYSLLIQSQRLMCITECRWSLTTEGGTLTETQVFSRKLPLMVVGQLGGVDVYVIVSMDALDDFPLDLVFGLLLWEQVQI